jgi:branched-chain amino acid transport system substrate-binding protein
VTYASLQALQQAIEKAGTIDREAVSKELASGTFDTILGTFSFDNPSRQIPGIFKVGQWQSGEFVGLYPADNEGAGTPVFPKPEWPPAQ